MEWKQSAKMRRMVSVADVLTPTGAATKLVASGTIVATSSHYILQTIKQKLASFTDRKRIALTPMVNIIGINMTYTMFVEY